MSAKTIIATGVSSNLGFEAIKLLLQQTATPYQFVLGVRSPTKSKADYAQIKYDADKHKLEFLEVDCANLKDVKRFAGEALAAVGSQPLSYLFHNAGYIHKANAPGQGPSYWCDSEVVNHLSQHYLTHLLREKIEQSRTRIVFTNSAAPRGVKDAEKLEDTLKQGSDADFMEIYSASKLTQLLSVHWWRRQLGDKAVVLTVSPGLIPGTQLARNSETKLPADHPDAKTVEQGAENLVRALLIEEEKFPSDPEQVFLTSWGEWWPSDQPSKFALDKALQDKWSPALEAIEKAHKL